MIDVCYDYDFSIARCLEYGTVKVILTATDLLLKITEIYDICSDLAMRTM